MTDEKLIEFFEFFKDRILRAGKELHNQEYAAAAFTLGCLYEILKSHRDKLKDKS